MVTPNWKHNSGKEPKRTLKPQAMRARKEALRQFKKRHMNPSKRRVLSYYESIRTEHYVGTARNQIPTC